MYAIELGVPGGAIQTRTVIVGSAQIQIYMTNIKVFYLIIHLGFNVFQQLGISFKLELTHLNFFVALGIYILKGSVRENERGYRLRAKNNRFLSLLILILSVAYAYKEKIVKTEICSVHTNSESCNIPLGS